MLSLCISEESSFVFSAPFQQIAIDSNKISSFASSPEDQTEPTSPFPYMSCSTVFRLHGGPHLTHLVYQSPFIFNNHRWRYMETSVFLALLPFLFDGHFTSNSKTFYSTKLVTSEHNFPVHGQVSLFTMPADLKQTNPFCDFIVGILISTERSHAPLGHHHPIRNISLLHHHDKQTRA